MEDNVFVQVCDPVFVFVFYQNILRSTSNILPKLAESNYWMNFQTSSGQIFMKSSENSFG